ncbi:MAG: hypothetical protein PHI52_01445 [Bacteroidales bacterium]|nr:hypothetical protein [Bacteroidales bacterium]
MSGLNKILKNSRNHLKSIKKLMVYKKQNIFFILCFIAFGIISCVKQSGCEDCKKGTLIIFNKTNSEEKKEYQYSDEIKAKFILEGDSSYYGIGILGTIPLNYKNKDTFNVCITFKSVGQALILPYVAKIKCIEKIEK